MWYERFSCFFPVASRMNAHNGLIKVQRQQIDVDCSQDDKEPMEFTVVVEVVVVVVFDEW